MLTTAMSKENTEKETKIIKQLAERNGYDIYLVEKLIKKAKYSQTIKKLQLHQIE